jgi:hypothetical protein
MFKKIAITASLAALALSSSVTFAAGEARHSISLIAHVPTNGFYVVPTDADLVNNGFFDVRNNNGSVHASLESVPQLIYGNETIPLQVSFNNKVLTQTPQMVVGESESDVNYRAPLKISAQGTTFNPGDYTGTVAMTFDAVPPVITP